MQKQPVSTIKISQPPITATEYVNPIKVQPNHKHNHNLPYWGMCMGVGGVLGRLLSRRYSIWETMS